MTTIAFVTFCHPTRYVAKLHRPGVLRGIVESHHYPFDDVVVIHQKCRAADYPAIDYPCRTVDLPREAFDPLLSRFNINPDQPYAEEISHGEGAAHWWKAHVVNHVQGAETTKTDYIVFADCDTYMKSQPPDRSWVAEGQSILAQYPQVLIVSPGDGGMTAEAYLPNGMRLTRNVSQQLFLCRGYQFRHEIDFDVPWDRQYNAPGGPLQEWYVMLEGRLGRYMNVSGTWRAMLPDKWRYWHDSYWGNDA